MAIHVAAQEGHAEIVKLLVENGADLFILTRDSRSAMDIAASKRHRSVVTVLASAANRSQHKSPTPQNLPPSQTRSIAPNKPVTTPLAPVRKNAALEDMLYCPITGQIMEDPVVVGDGHTYERAAIVEWIQNYGTSPWTKKPISVQILVPNLNLKHQVEIYKATRDKRE